MEDIKDILHGTDGSRQLTEKTVGSGKSGEAGKYVESVEAGKPGKTVETGTSVETGKSAEIGKTVETGKSVEAGKTRETTVLLELRDIRKGFGKGENRVEVLRGISLDVKKGEFCVLLGPSGSGKSTLLNIIGGIDSTDSGEILIGGERMSCRGRRFRDPQDPRDPHDRCPQGCDVVSHGPLSGLLTAAGCFCAGKMSC